MTIASGMRPRRLRLPTALADGGTGARTAQEAVAALGVPSLEGDNTFTGDNHFGTIWSNRVGSDSDLTLFTTDHVSFESAGGPSALAVLWLDGVTTTRGFTLPDKDGTFAMLSDITAMRVAYTAQGSVYTASTADCVINCTGTWTLTLPTAVGVSGRFYYIKNSGAGVITMAGTGGQTIDGAATQAVAASACMQVCSDGANWIIL